MVAYMKPCGVSCEEGGSPCAEEPPEEFYLRGQAPYDEQFELVAGDYVFKGYDTYGDGWNGSTARLTGSISGLIFDFEPECQRAEGGCPIGDAFGLGSPPPTGDNNGEVYFTISTTEDVSLLIPPQEFDEEISWDIEAI